MLFSLFFFLLLCTGGSFTVAGTSKSLEETKGGRVLQEETERCSICVVDGVNLLNNGTVTPEPWTSVMLRPPPDFLRNKTGPFNWVFDSNYTMTCADWDDLAASKFPVRRGDGVAKGQCIDLRDYLREQCCDDGSSNNGGRPLVAPLYACRNAAQRLVLNAQYEKAIAPIVRGAKTVDIRVEFDTIEIADYGVGGGAVTVTGEVTEEWVDERLRFPNIVNEMGCTSFSVDSDKIWTPALAISRDRLASEEDEEDGEVHNYFPDSTRATVLADGRVYWTRYGRTTLHCVTSDGASKVCGLEWRDTRGKGEVVYAPKAQGNDGGVGIRSLFSIPGYRINEQATNLTVDVEPAVRRVKLTFRFDPIAKNCSICGDDKRSHLIPHVVPNHGKWLERFPDTKGHTCEQLNDYLATLAVGNRTCGLGLALFEESCCDDVRSSFVCESNIHDTLAGLTNTVTPPDPSKKEAEDRRAKMEDFVDVTVSLDIAHVMGISVKSNTIELLVGLELEWYDDRLSWKPFLGGCHRASFRASMNPEATEIWVPNIDLVNMAEGVNSLPEEHASVTWDGHVMWRRSGVLTATCELEGIQNFPFDISGCFLDFGGMRNPLFHRVKYIPKNIQYSHRVKDQDWNFQEYKLLTNRTTVSMRNETLSGFDNEIIRYQFYFRRASGYYTNMFVTLYIIFTLLSFGMFFVDYRIGERLGYGSSILFVIVAQDITMSEFTPVTQEFLWIFKLSLGSKIFVIAGIIQSIIILYIFYYEEDDLATEEEEEEDDEEEIKPFLETAYSADGNCVSRGRKKQEYGAPAKDSEILESETQLSMSTLSATPSPVDLENYAEGLALEHEEEDEQGITEVHDRLERTAADAAASSMKTKFEGEGRDSSSDEKPKGGRAWLPLFLSKKFFHSKVVKKVVGKNLVIKQKDSEKTRRMKKLWMVDKITALFFVVAYSIFLIAIFLTLTRA